LPDAVERGGVRRDGSLPRRRAGRLHRHDAARHDRVCSSRQRQRRPPLPDQSC